MKCNLRSACLAALVFVSAAGIGSAQTSFGRISGTVTDPSGAAIPGAKVTFTNTETQNTRTVLTDDNGQYIITNLAIGPYDGQADQKGFQRQQQTGIRMVADGRLTVDFHLQLGDVSQTVEVVAQGGVETLNTTSGELAHVIDTQQVENLALNGGNYVQLMTLVPGVVVTNPDQFSVTTSLSATNQTINGNRSDSQNLTVDGAFNLVAGSNGSLMNNVNPNFIQEVKIQTSNANAEYRPHRRRGLQRRHQERHQPVPRRRLRDLPQRRARRPQLLLGPEDQAALQRFRLHHRRPDQERQAVLLLGPGLEAPAAERQPVARDRAYHRAAQRQLRRPAAALLPGHQHPDSQQRHLVADHAAGPRHRQRLPRSGSAWPRSSTTRQARTTPSCSRTTR